MTWILSPLSWLLLAGVLLVPAMRLQACRRWLLVACGTLACLGFAGTMPLVANALVARLEVPAAAARTCHDAPPTVAVVLAAGIDVLPQDAGDDGALDIDSRRRMDEGVAYWRAAPGRELVVTGTSGNAGVPDARLMAIYAERLGVPSAQVRIEALARTTWENARRVAALTPAMPRRIALVTSAMHMPRARYAFEAAGFGVCPVPAGRRWLPTAFPASLLPHSSALAKTEAALHELVGLGYYRLRRHDEEASAEGERWRPTR